MAERIIVFFFYGNMSRHMCRSRLSIEKCIWMHENMKYWRIYVDSFLIEAKYYFLLEGSITELERHLHL